MSSERWGLALVAALLILTGAAAWALALHPRLQVDAGRLHALPLTIGDWQGRNIPLDQTVEDMLHADANVQRAYLHPLGALVWLYVGYYGTDRGGSPEHTPRACYEAHGWRIVESRAVTVDPVLGLRANEFVVAKDGERRLVHFWYRTVRRTGILGLLGLGLDHMEGRLTQGRADGALVRLSTPLDPSGEAVARSRLNAFATELSPLLAADWPREQVVR